MITELDNINIIEFDWDEGNIKKNEIKHKVYYKECEQVFINSPLISKDIKHSKSEKRFNCLGKTNLGKILFITFTMRNLKIRVISARSASRREKTFYEKTKKATNI